MLAPISILIAVLAFPASIVCRIDLPDLLDQRCLDCFREGTTGGNLSYGCTKFDVCGPYRIGYLYWIDGGSLGEVPNGNRKEDFRACAKNKLCAEKTIQNYMQLYQTDCNRSGGDPDCVDFFRIHLAGQGGCPEKLLEKRLEWLRFLECFLNTAPNLREALSSIGGKLHRE